MGREERIGELRARIVATARELFVEVLRRDAALQEKGQLGMLGEDYEEIDGSWPRVRGADQVSIAWNFYDSWISARDHEFMGDYGGFKKDEWPRNARYIPDQLEGKEPIEDPVLLEEFGPRPGRSFVESIKGLFRRK